MSLVLLHGRRHRAVLRESDLYPLVMGILLDEFRGYKVLYQHRVAGGVPDFMVDMYGDKLPVEVKTYVSRRDVWQVQKYGAACVAVPKKAFRYAAEVFDCIILIPVDVVRRAAFRVAEEAEEEVETADAGAVR
ncbi:MAG: hypothetical protein ACP5MH_11780 [Thermoproteus sp.]